MRESLAVDCNVFGIITDRQGHVRVVKERNHLTPRGIEWIVKSAFRDILTKTGTGAVRQAVLGSGLYTPDLTAVSTPVSVKKNFTSNISYNNGLLQITSETWSTIELPDSTAAITNVGVEIEGIPINVAPFTFDPDGTQTLALIFRFLFRGG